jgi:type 1 fimbria pilin
MKKNKRTGRGLQRVKAAGIACLLASVLPAGGYAANNGEIDGENGMLHVYGALTEGACVLDMSSSRQEVRLGKTSSAELRHMGDRGRAVQFVLVLKDCSREASRAFDERSENIAWDTSQPSVSVSFSAPQDELNPELIALHGANGVGLRITDADGENIPLNEETAPQLLTPGRNELVYAASAERTEGELQAGAWQSEVNFRLNYY